METILRAVRIEVYDGKPNPKTGEVPQYVTCTEVLTGNMWKMTSFTDFSKLASDQKTGVLQVFDLHFEHSSKPYRPEGAKMDTINHTFLKMVTPPKPRPEFAQSSAQKG